MTLAKNIVRAEEDERQVKGFHANGFQLPFFKEMLSEE
jgi:hypothetical protein